MLPEETFSSSNDFSEEVEQYKDKEDVSLSINELATLTLVVNKEGNAIQGTGYHKGLCKEVQTSVTLTTLKLPLELLLEIRRGTNQDD